MTDQLQQARKAYAKAAYMLAHQREKFQSALHDAMRKCAKWPHLYDACEMLREHWNATEE